MKLKKVVSAILVGAMVVSMVACGNSKTNSNGGKASVGSTEASTSSTKASGSKLVIWTLAKDLQQFADRYKQQHPGVDIETVVIDPADYPTKVQTALLGGEKEPDIIVGEPQMLEDMYDAGFFEDLNKAPYNAQNYKDKIVNYAWDVGQDSKGVQRAISYQITPAGIYYRRDIAKKVFGTDNPTEVGKLFASYSTILTTAQKLKESGYRIFASDAEINYFSGDSAWVKDNTLNVDKARYDYMDLCVNLYKSDLTAYANQWSTPWYQAMSGPIPILSADIQGGKDKSVNVWDSTEFSKATKDMPTTEVFAYGLPSWGVLTMRDNVKDTSGKWGVCAGPSKGFGGGTYIGISAQSDRKDLAWDFLKFCTLNEDTAEWWINASQGDTVSLKSVLEKHKDDANTIYGGEQLYKFWLDQAEGIDYSKVTRYDKAIGDAWGNAISAIKKGEKSKDDAIKGFYDEVQSTYPDLTIKK